jgi:hypothetical protein
MGKKLPGIAAAGTIYGEAWRRASTLVRAIDDRLRTIGGQSASRHGMGSPCSRTDLEREEDQCWRWSSAW